jgi:hypothetical protein
MVTHRLFDRLNVLGVKYSSFLLYTWADCTHRPSLLVRVLGYIAIGFCRLISFRTASTFSCSGPLVGLQPDV